MEQPVVCVGCPIQNRDFIVKEYLQCIYNLDYPKDKLIPAFFVNNTSDQTGKIIQEWMEKHREKYFNILYFEKQKVYKGKIDSQLRDKRDFTLFAVVRNLFLKYIIPYPFHYFFSVDSDILFPPETLKQLLSHHKDIISCLVWNGTVFGVDNYNYRKYMQDNRGVYNYFQYQIQPGELFEVDITGACYLMKREVLDAGIRYKAHKKGEDWEFCVAAKESGFKLYCDPTIPVEHKAKWG
jgi:hypothetical protein